MDAVNLFSLASQQSRWLSVRQAAIAGNVANVNTPGYGAVEVEPFESVLNGKRVSMAATSSMHMVGGASTDALKVSPEDHRVALMPSENTVVLESELIKAGEVRRAFEMNTAIVKAFHRMTMLTSKG